MDAPKSFRSIAVVKKLEFIAAYCINRGDDVSPVDTTSLPNLYLL